MGYLTKMNGESGRNGFSAVGFSILGQAPRSKRPEIGVESMTARRKPRPRIRE